MGKVYKACVQRVLVYGSEVWPIKVEYMQRLERSEKMMVRWMCGVKLKNKISSVELYSRLDGCGGGVGRGEAWQTKMVWSS